jgi:hypothetical protein
MNALFLQDDTKNSPSKSPLLRLKTLGRLARGRVPGQVVIQYTDRCNASCAQCGMRASSRFQRSTMQPEQVKRLIDAMAQRGVEAISFTGGEPLLCLDDIAPLISYAGQAGIRFIRTGTNGFIFRNPEAPDFLERVERIAATLAATPLNTFWISVDSAVAALHEQNRGFAGIVEGMRRALPIFHSHGLYPSANLGINRHTGGDGADALPCTAPEDFEPEAFHQAARKAFHRFYSFVHALGFTIVNACYPMSSEEGADSDAVYAATATDDFIRFSIAEKIQLFRALSDTVPEFRSRMRIFTPRSSLLALVRQYQGSTAYTPCRGGIDFFFIDAKDMNTYPCGYRGGENLGKFWDLDLGALDTPPFCDKCDWECFRDPSELVSPFAEALQHPLSLAGRLIRDAEMRALWLEDLRYYRACEYFNARRPPNLDRLSRFCL